MPLDIKLEGLEPQALDFFNKWASKGTILHAEQENGIWTLSIALSLKRIADSLEAVIDHSREEWMGPAIRTQPGGTRQ